MRLGGVTSSNGAFEFLRVIPGTYRVTASAASTPIMIMENGTVVGVRDGPKADPSFGTISVTVGTQEVTGAMIPMARGIRPKLLYQPEAGCSAAASIMLSPMVEWGGGTVRNDLQAGKEVTLAELPLSPFAVELSAPGPAVCFTPLTEIDLNQASPDSPIVIPGIRFGAIQGKADTAGQPAEDFEVVLTPSDGTAAKRFALDAAARFAIPNLRPGRYRVGARRIAGPGVPKEMQEIEVGSGSSIEIEFPATP
ncbi:MAG: carboxypeptidase-like regulatory domain-containing protein [Acidobacteriota bacterium]